MHNRGLTEGQIFPKATYLWPEIQLSTEIINVNDDGTTPYHT